MQWKKAAAGACAIAAAVAIFSGSPFFLMADAKQPNHDPAIQDRKPAVILVKQNRFPSKYLTFSPAVNKRNPAHALSFSLPAVRRPIKQEAKKHNPKPAPAKTVTVIYTPELQ